MLLLAAILLLTVVVSAYLVTLWHRLQNCNQKPLDIKTFDNSNSPYHPSVFYFKEGWNGYKYWMAETPFSPSCKPYRDRNECPSIHVSNDGIIWSEISKNPIDDLTEKEVANLDYFSDPHLVFVKDRLECWYRKSDRHSKTDNHGNVTLNRKTTYDGKNWTEREILVDFKTGKSPLGKMVVSHSVIYTNSKYHIWYVDREHNITGGDMQREILYSISIDGKDWSVTNRCTLSGKETNPWHIDVNFIDGTFWLICYNYTDLTLWSSSNGIDFTYIKTILSPASIGSFYSNGLYRAVLIKDDKYKLYFSADNYFKTFIGIMEGDDPTSLKIVSGKMGQFCSFLNMGLQIWLRKKNSAKFICRHFIKKITQR